MRSVQFDHGIDAAKKMESTQGSFLSKAAKFHRDENGSLIIFSLFIFVLMLMIGGMAVDMMRYENTRTKLQNTLDRSILAAADLDQTLDPQAVVEDYFDKAGMRDYLLSVTVDQGLNYRTVSAIAATDVRTLFMPIRQSGSSGGEERMGQFLDMMGDTPLHALAGGAAEERVSNVEISLVVDISGSMGRNNKIYNLRVAAKEFVDTVIREEAEDLISLSIIPYTAHVNAGPAIFNQINNMSDIPRHDYSYCVDFIESDFNDTGLDFSTNEWGDYNRIYKQMQHFEWSSSSYHPIRNPGCPMRDYEHIVPLSQDVTAMHNTIDNYRARANTAIHIGMKWGSILLDPSTRPIVQELANQGIVDSAFSTRPAAWDDDETMKVVVLMTDGENVNTNRIEDWAYNDTSRMVYWSQNTLWYHLYRNVSYSYRHRFYDTVYTASQADTMLDNICDAAKAQDITVFTIGFEVSNHGADVMRSCASTVSHFFRVEGTEISQAFNAIARQINQLRLTQ